MTDSDLGRVLHEAEIETAFEAALAAALREARRPRKTRLARLIAKVREACTRW